MMSVIEDGVVLLKVGIHSAILDFVLLPLGVMWSHNSLMDVLKRNVVLFKPEVRGG